MFITYFKGVLLPALYVFYDIRKRRIVELILA